MKRLQSNDLMVCSVKVAVPDELRCKLDALYNPSIQTVRWMLQRRSDTSSKFWKQVPCVVAKSLSDKYQRNHHCLAVRHIVIPICGDKGRQVKLVKGGIRVPAIFGKAILKVVWSHPVSGYVRHVEFFRRSGRWLASISYNTLKAHPVVITGVVGVDRNSVGNIAVLADPQNGTVRKLGICPSRTKAVMRGRRRNLQKAGKLRLLSKLRRKQRRRMTYENHRASKSVVDYAALHCRAVAIENLSSAHAEGSKIRRYSERNQWAFAQLESFLRYKCALRGVPVIEVNPAWTSQTCSRCGSRHKPNGKVFLCGNCGRTAHRDVNAAFNIATLGLTCIGGGNGSPNVLPLRPNGGPQAEKALQI